MCFCHPRAPFSEAQRQEIMRQAHCGQPDGGSADVGAAAPPPRPGPAGKGRGTPQLCPALLPPAPATELIGPPRCLWPPAAVCPGATVHPVRQAQRGGCEVSGVGGGLGRGGGPWGLGRACLRSLGAPDSCGCSHMPRGGHALPAGPHPHCPPPAPEKGRLSAHGWDTLALAARGTGDPQKAGLWEANRLGFDLKFCDLWPMPSSPASVSSSALWGQEAMRGDRDPVLGLRDPQEPLPHPLPVAAR